MVENIFVVVKINNFNTNMTVNPVNTLYFSMFSLICTVVA